jgi:uncharacterized RDD family membrane protein YckC
MEKYKTSEQRIMALLVDGIILVIFTAVQNQVLSYTSSNLSANLVLLTFSFLSLAYLTLPVYFYGQTIGKWLLKIQVVDISETKKLTFLQVTFRNPAYAIAILLSLPFIAYIAIYNEVNAYLESLSKVVNNYGLLWYIAEIITFLTNSKRRALHDFIAGTVVVRTDYLENLRIEKTA